MIHPHTKLDFVSESVGYGVFATQFIPKGTIVYVKDDLEVIVTPDSMLLKDEKYRKVIDTYSYRDESGNYILSWDIAKYVNHCCEANSISTGYGFEIATRDIQSGEQITDEYGLLNIEEDIPLTCEHCTCRGKVSNMDYLKYLPEWDLKAKEAVKLIRKVKQPLWEYVDDSTQEEVMRYVKSKRFFTGLERTILKEAYVK